MARKLYEFLAIESQLKGQADAARKDLKNTFEKKRHLFEEKLVTFQSTEENVPEVTEAQSSIQTTIPSELDWIATLWGKALDASAAIDTGNTTAKADVTLDDGTVILKDVPATTLLDLEKRTAEMQDLVMAIPTLDPAKSFEPDSQRKDTYRAREVRKTRTKKTQRAIVLYHATTEHPAQTQLIPEDVPVGTVREQEWSSLLTPKIKGEILERVEELRRAVKAARQRANDGISIETPAVGSVLFQYAFKAVKPNGKK